jgi:hypothetical protein
VGSLCHRAASIATTSGWKDTLLHLLQLAEMAIPTLAGIFLEINALIIAIMIVCLIAHGATAICDVSYAYSTREVTPTEQHVHRFSGNAAAERAAYCRDHALAAVSGVVRLCCGGRSVDAITQTAAASLALCQHHSRPGAPDTALSGALWRGLRRAPPS